MTQKYITAQKPKKNLKASKYTKLTKSEIVEILKLREVIRKLEIAKNFSKTRKRVFALKLEIVLNHSKIRNNLVARKCPKILAEIPKNLKLKIVQNRPRTCIIIKAQNNLKAIKTYIPEIIRKLIN